MKILVTGHDGFIGRNMVGWLSLEGWEVTGWEWEDTVRPDVRGYDWVIHLGAVADVSETDVNKVLTQNLEFSQWLFTECQHHGVNLQYASSSSVYGNSRHFEESTDCQPQTAYAWSKYLFDRWAFQQRQTNFVQGFRYFNVYGKWQHLRGHRANVIDKWRKQATQLGHIEVWDNAEHIYRDWTWVGDVCRLHIDFIKQVKGSGIWNVGAGLPHSFLDIAEHIAEQHNVDVRTVTMPHSELPRFRQKTCADLTHLKETIGKRKWLNVYEWLDLE